MTLLESLDLLNCCVKAFCTVGDGRVSQVFSQHNDESAHARGILRFGRAVIVAVQDGKAQSPCVGSNPRSGLAFLVGAGRKFTGVVVNSFAHNVAKFCGSSHVVIPAYFKSEIKLEAGASWRCRSQEYHKECLT